MPSAAGRLKHSIVDSTIAGVQRNFVSSTPILASFSFTTLAYMAKRFSGYKGDPTSKVSDPARRVAFLVPAELSLCFA